MRRLPKRPASSKLKKKKKPARSKKPKNLVNDDAVLRLIEKGRNRGFITESEILHVFPNIERDIEGLESLYERLDGANINVVDTGRVFAEERENKDFEEKRKLEQEQIDAGSDSVQMYLREIGKYPLLTGDEEVDLAKKNEHGDESARQNSCFQTFASLFLLQKNMSVARRISRFWI